MSEHNTRKDLLRRAAKLGLPGASRMGVGPLRRAVEAREATPVPLPGPVSILVQMDAVVRSIHEYQDGPTQEAREHLEGAVESLNESLVGTAGTMRRLGDSILELANLQFS